MDIEKEKRILFEFKEYARSKGQKKESIFNFWTIFVLGIIMLVIIFAIMLVLAGIGMMDADETIFNGIICILVGIFIFSSSRKIIPEIINLLNPKIKEKKDFYKKIEIFFMNEKKLKTLFSMYENLNEKEKEVFKVLFNSYPSNIVDKEMRKLILSKIN